MAARSGGGLAKIACRSAAVWPVSILAILAEVLSRHRIEFEGKRRFLQRAEGIRNMVDGIVRLRRRAVPAGVGGEYLVVHRIEAFSVASNSHGQRFAVIGNDDTARVGIQSQFGIDEIAMKFCSSQLHAVRLAALFVGW